jgi:hypothetical protein
MSEIDNFEANLEWRLERWRANLTELLDLTSADSLNPFESLPDLIPVLEAGSQVDALAWSILLLWLEAANSYVLGQFQASILSSGAVVERILKLEYMKINGELPQGMWTLGKCIYDLDFVKTKITEEILGIAKECLDPRNDRSHALLEHENPDASMLGGQRGIHVISNNRYLIEPYRGEARGILVNTWRILNLLFAGSP